MAAQLNKEQLTKLAVALNGTMASVECGIRRIGANPADFNLLDIEKRLAVVRCGDCGWWYETWELRSEDKKLNGYCWDCRPRPAKKKENICAGS